MLLADSRFSGVMIHNLEEIELLTELGYAGKIITAPNLYIWNKRSYAFWQKQVSESCLPYELNLHEWEELEICGAATAVVYGRIPMMVTANCIGKTQNQCAANPDQDTCSILTDRMKNQFPVIMNCRHCYNVIYNAVPLSLHRYLNKLKFIPHFLLSFTTEDGKETQDVLQYYESIWDKTVNSIETPDFPYTTGQIKRMVE